MKALLLPVIMAISAAGGVMAADFARGTISAPADGAARGKTADAHGKSTGGDHKTASQNHGDKGHGGDSQSGETEFLKFKRQFVVPVVKNQDVQALVLLNIALEVPADQHDNMFRMEPRFRDAFIRELLQLSDTGYFDTSLTSPDTYEALRETLYRAANEVSSEGVSDVLILDLTRQDR